MQFKHVIGQERIKAELVALAKDNRVPHSMLFAGKEGHGTLPLVLAFVQFIFCENRQESDSCGQCKSCLKHDKIIHPDFHISFPILGSDKLSLDYLPSWRSIVKSDPYIDLWDWTEEIGDGNKQLNINNRECLEKIRLLGLKSFESKYKAWLIWMPEYLGNLANKLLKLLEEPPENTFIFLVSMKPEALLGTILSRCQTFRINPIDNDALISFLIQEGVQIDKAREIAMISSGNIKSANAIVLQKDHSYGEKFIAWLRMCYKLDPIQTVDKINSIAQMNREQLKHFVIYGLYFLRKCLQEFCGVKIDVADIEESRSIKGITKLLNLEKIISIQENFERMLASIERNASPKILFMDCTIQIHRILRSVSKEAELT